MSTSLRRTGSISSSSKRASATPTTTTLAKRGSTFLGSGRSMDSSLLMDFGVVTPEAQNRTHTLVIADEVTGLRKIVEGLNKTNTSLRGRISELETHIERETGPEVMRLSKELSTLEDLFEQTQRDNELKHAESERQKAYVKELENLLSATAGPDWRESHNLFPPASTALIVTASTPLPKPKVNTPHFLRHSVSFANKHSASKSHRRASSTMDLGLIGLQAVKEDDAVDDTPTVALRRLTGVKEKNVASKRQGQTDGPVLASTPAEKVTSIVSSEGNHPENPDRISTALPPSIDVTQLNTVLQLLSSSNLIQALSSLQEHNYLSAQEPSMRDPPKSKDAEIKMIRRMISDQEARLVAREAELNAIVLMAEEKERKYAVTP